MQLPEVIEARGQRVLTSAQIAECYNTSIDCIKQNFHANKRRYKEGKHYIALAGKELKEFKEKVRKSHLVCQENEKDVRLSDSALKTKYQFDTQFKYAKSLYLWTEKGALLHAKSLNTDKAWEVYDYLVDFYFRAREEKQSTTKNEVVPTSTTTEKIKEDDSLPIMEEPIAVFQNLIAFANINGIQVKLKPLQSHNSILNNRRLAVREGMSFEKVTYEIAYELAHYCIHHKDGNLINSPLAKEYNGQAERAAVMMIHMLDVKVQRY